MQRGARRKPAQLQERLSTVNSEIVK